MLLLNIHFVIFEIMCVHSLTIFSFPFPLVLKLRNYFTLYNITNKNRLYCVHRLGYEKGNVSSNFNFVLKKFYI